MSLKVRSWHLESSSVTISLTLELTDQTRLGDQQTIGFFHSQLLQLWKNWLESFVGYENLNWLNKMPRNDFWTLHAHTRPCIYIHEYVHTYKHTQASCAARSQLTILHAEWHHLYFEQQSINVCSGPMATLQTQDVISHSGFNYSFLKKWCWISFHIIWRF